ncbi:hypothetical protein KKE06_01500 [Candidatus Micrarchaeota archaeon]|nr:hypothetical protein [Candidatus Micrarchaeota archaeon]MBU1930299.1 hypothetical protein [Candidatus Micrarchaeota archaeon]
MAGEDDFDEDGQAMVSRKIRGQTNPLFYIILGVVIGFIISMIFSPGLLPVFGEMSQFDGNVTQVNKFVSQDLRSVKVVLRINDSNIATCTEGDICLGYQEGDLVSVTCFGNDCQATKK